MADILFDENMIFTIIQSLFLINEQNKNKFIKKLFTYLKNNGYTVLQAADDADIMIVNEAILKAKNESDVIIVGEYRDILVLLISLTSKEKILSF